MYKILAMIGAVALAVSPGIAFSQDSTTATEAPPAGAAAAQNSYEAPPTPPMLPAPVFEYVQQASSMQFDGKTMTLGGMAPSTIYFSDRPYRLIGHVDNKTFSSLWDKSGGTFAADPPNAAVSVLGEIDEAPAIVELTSVEVADNSVKYGVRMISGKLPDSAENVAIFIDRGPGFHGGYHGGPHMGGGYPPPHHGGYHPYPPPPPHHGGYYPPYHPYHPYPPYPPPYHPYHPYYPYPPHPYYPAAVGAAALTGAAIGAAAASSSQPQQVYVYPVPGGGQLPSHCWLNSSHTRMICSVQLANPPQ